MNTLWDMIPTPWGTSNSLKEPFWHQPQILCLHGWRSNNDVTLTHAKHLLLHQRFSGGVIPLHGPIAAPGAADEATGAFFEGPFYSHVEKDADRETQTAQLLDALHAVIHHCHSHGVYDSVYGFSQGAAIVTLLSIPEVLKKLGAPGQLWRSAILACAASNDLLQLAQDALGVSILNERSGEISAVVKIPSLHIIGADDVYKDISETFLQLFTSRKPEPSAAAANGARTETELVMKQPCFVRHVVYFTGGHGIPHGLSTDTEFQAEFDTWWEAQQAALYSQRHHPGAAVIPWAWAPQRSLRHSLTRSFTRALSHFSITSSITSQKLGKSRNVHATLSSKSSKSSARSMSYGLNVKQQGRRNDALILAAEAAIAAADAETETDIDAAEKGLLDSHGRSYYYTSTVLETLEVLENLDFGVVGAPGGGILRFDATTRAIIHCQPTAAASSNITIPDLLKVSPPSAPFLRTHKDAGGMLSYGRLLEFLQPGGAGDLRRSGVESPNQMVVFSVPPGLVGAVALLTIASQATASPLDPGAAEDDVADVIHQLQSIRKGADTRPHASNVVLLGFRGVTSAAFEAAAGKAGIYIQWNTIGEDGFYKPESSEHLTRMWEANAPLANPPNGVALLLRTSGSTATPKVVPISTRALCANAAALAQSLALTPEDIALNAMPLFHIGGISASILATAAAGGSVVCLNKFEPVMFCEVLTSGVGSSRVGTGQLPTWFTAVPTIHLSLLTYATEEFNGKPPTHALRFIRSGAAALSPSDTLKLSSFWGVNVITSYSMTEQMPISSKPLSLNTDTKTETVGQPVCCSVVIVDNATLRPVPWDHQGELCISGLNIIPEYVNNPAANAKSFFWIGDQRYFRTGDIAMLDKAGCIYLVGRSKELIKVGGEQVSPPEIEAVVGKHPGVAAVVVFGVPSPAWGEEVGVAVVLKDGAVGKILRDLQPDANSTISTSSTDVSSIKDISYARDGLGVSCPAGTCAAGMSEEAIIADIRKFALTKLAARKVPAHWRIVSEKDLPKTAAGKYIRVGLAEKLGVSVQEFTLASGGTAATEHRPPPRTSTGLNGMRYIMAVGVMFNHISAVWQGEDERNPLTFGPAFFPGKATTFYFPATLFFVLGGYSLSAALAARPVKKGSWWSFYNARFQALMPLYLLALLLALINLLVTCRPETFSTQFSWQPESSVMVTGDGGVATCQTSPVEMPYGAWLFMTLLIFILGLQAWFFAFVFVGWILYYAWFNSVYYFAVLLFPWMHNALVRCRGNLKGITTWLIIYGVGIYLTCLALGAYYWLPNWTEADTAQQATSWNYNKTNLYALATILFPPYWIPCVGAGMAAYFWYDCVRPAESHSWRWYGIACDLLTTFFLAWHIAMFIDIDWPYPTSFVGKLWEEKPEEPHVWDGALDRYVWSVLSTRLMTPLIVLWVALASMPGKSLTAKFFEWRPLAMTLGPTSYGCFLFHQIIGQWYWWATRAGATAAAAVSAAGEAALYPPAPDASLNTTNIPIYGTNYNWWSYRKHYYWFSPIPVPVTFYEFFPVVALTTFFSLFCNTYLNAPLTLLWIKAFKGVGRVLGWAEEQQGLTAEGVVSEALEDLTGDGSLLDSTLSLDHLGLASVGLPMLVGMLNSKDDRLGLKVFEVAEVSNVGELVELVERKQKSAEQESGVGTAPL